METFLAWGGALVLAGNVGALIYKIIKPAIEINNRVEELERRDKLDFERLKKLEEELAGIHKATNAQNKMLLVIIDHMIDGNHTEEMKETRKHIIDMAIQE